MPSFPTPPPIATALVAGCERTLAYTDWYAMHEPAEAEEVPERMHG